MSASFSWKHPGLDEARFRAYSTLLHLQNGGQIDERSEIESELDEYGEDSIDEDDSSNANLIISSFDGTRLTEAFQDRVAELVSNVKGGQHVAATLLVHLPLGPKLIVAKNEGFNETEKEFMTRLQNHFREIARTPSVLDNGTRATLWNDMVTYSDTRLREWIADFQRVAKSFRNASQQDSTGDVAPDSLRMNISRALERSFIPSKPASTLVVDAHEIWKSSGMQEFLDLCDGQFQQASNLRRSIGFLGRLRIAFNVIVRTAERLDEFSALEIFPLTDWSGKKLRRSIKKQTQPSWSLKETFESLSKPLDDTNVKSIVGKNWTMHALVQKFDEQQSKAPQIHAEVQLVLHAVQQGFGEESQSQYIGCSKRSCFSCWELLGATGAFRTRATHGKIFSPWTVPEVLELSSNSRDGLVSALKKFENVLKSHLLGDNKEKHLPTAKESTVRDSSIATRVPFSASSRTMDLVLQHLLRQRHAQHNRALPESRDTDAMAEEVDDERNSGFSNVELGAVPDKDYDAEGHCCWCENITERLCPHCGVRYCSSSCAARSIRHRFRCAGYALTTADYLERAVIKDLIPDDPQTMEDYSFTRCETHMQQSHLGGLYKGLIQILEVTAGELDNWKTDGSLVDNIIGRFTTLPEGKRGEYFPWFLKHKEILFGDCKAEQTTPEETVLNALHKARAFLNPEDQSKDIDSLEPLEKRDAFFFLAFTCMHQHPRPEGPGDLWYSFGFCTCPTEYEEGRLGALYNSLLLGNQYFKDYDKSLGIERSRLGYSHNTTATFDEFWQAYRDGKLIELMDNHGLRRELQNLPQLEVFLGGPRGRNWSVWRLCHFLSFDISSPNIPPLALIGAESFGFSTKLNARVDIELRELYKHLIRKGSPSELFYARSQGRLLDYAKGLVQDIDTGVVQVLRGLV